MTSKKKTRVQKNWHHKIRIRFSVKGEMVALGAGVAKVHQLSQPKFEIELRALLFRPLPRPCSTLPGVSCSVQKRATHWTGALNATCWWHLPLSKAFVAQTGPQVWTTFQRSERVSPRS